MKNPIVTIEMMSGKHISIEVMVDVAPNTCAAFMECVDKHIYDNQPIRRVVPGFVIQPSYNDFEDNPEASFEIQGEYEMNGFNNSLSFDPFVVGMGTNGGKTASGSCFFIVVGDGNQERLDGKFPAFGRVIEGFEELNRIQNVSLVDVPVEENVVIKEPLNPEIMKKVSISRNGYPYIECIKV